MYWIMAQTCGPQGGKKAWELIDVMTIGEVREVDDHISQITFKAYKDEIVATRNPIFVAHSVAQVAFAMDAVLDSMGVARVSETGL